MQILGFYDFYQLNYLYYLQQKTKSNIIKPLFFWFSLELSKIFRKLLEKSINDLIDAPKGHFFFFLEIMLLLPIGKIFLLEKSFTYLLDLDVKPSGTNTFLIATHRLYSQSIK